MRDQYYPDFPKGKTWETMSKEEKHTFVQESYELHYIQEYDETREWMDEVKTPEWEELTEEQRISIRSSIDDKHKFFTELGNSFATK